MNLAATIIEAEYRDACRERAKENRREAFSCLERGDLVGTIYHHTRALSNEAAAKGEAEPESPFLTDNLPTFEQGVDALYGHEQ